MKIIAFVGLFLACLLLGVHLPAAAELPGPVVPDGLGVNINTHFGPLPPGDLEMLAQGGFRWIRIDLWWKGMEPQKGVYNFAGWDELMAALEAHHLRAMMILAHSNPLYDNGLSPASDEGRNAFARWAAATVRHFRNRGVLWEMYNEPYDDFFWTPKADVKQYVKLALEVGKALREAEPGELYVGPATAHHKVEFLEECFKSGLLDYFSAVTLHCYREDRGPETVAADYARIRSLIDKYAPRGKKIPILSGEWGYSSIWKHCDEAKQGKYLPRQFLTNLACGVPLSIWFDWHGSVPDPQNPEHHTGIVRHPYLRGQSPVYEPKPAYFAAQTLTRVLNGYRFQRRLAVGGPDDYVLAFVKDGGDGIRLVAWTVAASPHTVVIATPPGRYMATGHAGEPLPVLAADANGLSVVLTDAPTYLVPEPTNR